MSNYYSLLTCFLFYLSFIRMSRYYSLLLCFLFNQQFLRLARYYSLLPCILFYLAFLRLSMYYLLLQCFLFYQPFLRFSRYFSLGGFPKSPLLNFIVAHTASKTSVVSSWGTSPIFERACLNSESMLWPST